jgi:amino acid transporter
MKLTKLNLYLAILKVVLISTGVIFCLFLFGGPNPEGATQAAVAEFRDGSKMSLATSFTTFILFVGVGLILLFFVVQLISNPKRTLLSILGLIAAFLIYLLFLMIGTGDTNESLQLRPETQVDLGTIGAATAGLYTALVGVAAGALVIILGLFSRMKK